MEWKTDGTARKKALKFKEDYERLFQEMTGSMESLAGEVVGYLKRENLRDDQEAVLNVISVLPGCWFRLYSRYYEIVGKPHKVVTNPECKVWKADREILRKAQDFAEDYEEKRSGCCRWRKMRKKNSRIILKEPAYGMTGKLYTK